MGENKLYHYGILGMKWGVRRYQNYDGTYTQKGLNRYRSAEEKYKSAKTKKKIAKESYSGPDKKTKIKELSIEQKRAKKEMEKAYKGLKTDKLADEGKALYKRGKTIGENTRKSYGIQGAIVLGSAVVNRILTSTMADQTLVNAMIAAKGYRENKRLRAYYAH